MPHPLHLATAAELARYLPLGAELLRDPACGGDHQLPLFIGRLRARDTRMCCVDLLLLVRGKVRVIVEIEESGFLPTKMCGKFLQSALADHFIHDRRTEDALAYDSEVLFIQILDCSKWKPGTRKDDQARLIERTIGGMLPVRGLTAYAVFLVRGPDDEDGLGCIGRAVLSALA